MKPKRTPSEGHQAPDPAPESRGEQAIRAFQEANNLDATPRLSQGDNIVYSAEAKRAREKAEALLTPTTPLAVRAGETIAFENPADEIFKGAHARIIDTLENPN